jgi:hypothetical protein
VDAPKNILETEKKTLKPSLLGKKPKKTPKHKKTHWAGFFLNPGFFQPCACLVLVPYPARKTEA